MNRTIVFLCAILFAASASDAFQFMSKWKMPSSIDVDNLEKVKERFGDKSKFNHRRSESYISFLFPLR